MSKVKMFNVMSVMVAVFFLSTGFAFAENWDLDGNVISNNNISGVKINTYLDFGILRMCSLGPNSSSIMDQNTFNSITYYDNTKIGLGGSLWSAFALNIDSSTGRIGIGTDVPPYLLSVDGTIGAREVIVTQETWPDFVFKEDYALPSLDKVESYIKENKHLPDIPSEEEIKEKGLSVADLMAKQMQKIEELTLYVIELKKDNKKLSDRLASLEQVK